MKFLFLVDTLAKIIPPVRKQTGKKILVHFETETPEVNTPVQRKSCSTLPESQFQKKRKEYP